MDDYTTVCKYDLYIPHCGNQRCEDSLNKIAKQLNKRGCQCVKDYMINGLWTEAFKQTFVDCCYTLLHVCPLLHKRISDVFSGDFIQDYFNKIICVQLARRSSHRVARSEDTCEHFFHKFPVQSVVDKVSVTEFVQRFMRQLDRSPAAPSAHSPDRRVCSYINPSGGATGISELLRNLQIYSQYEEPIPHTEVFPNELGRSGGREVYVGMTVAEEMSDKLSKMSTFAELKQHIDRFMDAPETAHSNVTFVLHKILPKLYEMKDSIGLATISACNQQILQKVALTYLELLVLNRSIATETGKLQDTEILLAKTACEMSIKYKKAKSGQEARVGMINKRIMNLLLMIHCQIISQKQASRSMELFHSTVGQILSETSANGCSGINKVITIIQSLNGVKAKAEQFAEYNASLANDLQKQTVATQAVVIFNCLMKIFSRLDSQVLHFVAFLQKYLKTRWLFRVPRVCSRMILRGVALFLKYSLKEAVHMEIRSVCSEVMNLIVLAPEGEFDDELNNLIRSLLFDKIPSVRHCVIDFFTKRGFYSDKKLPRLICDVIESLLCPLLDVDAKEKLQHSAEQWQTVLGTFGHQKVVVCFHKPTLEDHREKDCFRFIQHRDTMHQNQVSKLKKLKHPGVISLLAYQLENLPMFYILEDYMTMNLQMALKNRNDNRVYFTLSVLIKFLRDVAEAVEFCHKAGIAHINLTAASLFIVGDEERVKLGGFQLAVSLEERVEKVVDNVMSEVPTRWTAPESLRRHKFSKASDIWMFGHLMYEVLTHGVLPYSHLVLADEELVQKFFFDMSYCPPVQLFHETCMRREHYELIVACTRLDTKERPHISSVLTKLHCFHRHSADYKPQYPNLSDGKRQPSTAMRKGIPDVFGADSTLVMILGLSGVNMERAARTTLAATPARPAPQNIELIKEVRSMLTQYQLKEAFIFRETIQGQVSEALLSRLNDGSLDDIIPWVQHTTSTANSKVSFIDCYIPLSCGFCLLDQTRARKLGSKLQNYSEILLQIAIFLKNLHDKGVILGHMCASTFFLEYHDQKPKIFVASLGYACEIACYRRPPKDKDIRQSAAPEVRSSGSYSVASDVYCFGHLVTEVIEAFDPSLTKQCTEYYNDSRAREVSGALSHAACSYRLKHLVDICCTVEVTRRSTMEGLIDELARFNSDLNSEYCHVDSFLLSRETIGTRASSHAGFVIENEDAQPNTILKQICQYDSDGMSVYEAVVDCRSPNLTTNHSLHRSTPGLVVPADESNSCPQTETFIRARLNPADHERDWTGSTAADSGYYVASDSIHSVAPDSIYHEVTNSASCFAPGRTHNKVSDSTYSVAPNRIHDKVSDSTYCFAPVCTHDEVYGSTLVAPASTCHEVPDSTHIAPVSTHDEVYESTLVAPVSTRHVASISIPHVETDSLTLLKQFSWGSDMSLCSQTDNSHGDTPSVEVVNCGTDSHTFVKTAAHDFHDKDVEIDVKTTNPDNTTHVYDKLPSIDSTFSTSIYATLNSTSVVQLTSKETFL